jgi:hypothetical protein
MRASIALLALVGFALLGPVALAEERTEAEVDRLATVMRQSCTAMTRSPRDERQIAAQLGPLDPAAESDETVVRVARLPFAKVVVMAADDLTPALTVFELRPPRTVSLEQLERRFGRSHEGIDEIKFAAPKFLHMSEEAVLLAAAAAGAPGGAPHEEEADFATRLRGVGKDECWILAFYVDGAPKGPRRSVVKIQVRTIRH